MLFLLEYEMHIFAILKFLGLSCDVILYLFFTQVLLLLLFCPHGVNVILLLDPSLPSSGWLLAGLHLLTHPLHHALHPNWWLTVVLILFHLLRPFKVIGFVLGFATMIGRYKSLLRSLMLRYLEPRCMRPKGLILRSLMPWCMPPWSLVRCLIPWSLMLGQRSSAMISLFGHFFLSLRLLCFKEGALGRTCPLRPQWWHIGDLLMECGF
jgi:hypothetical protein